MIGEWKLTSVLKKLNPKAIIGKTEKQIISQKSPKAQEQAKH